MLTRILTTYVSEALYKKLRCAAHLQNKSMSQIVRETVETALQDPVETKSACLIDEELVVDDVEVEYTHETHPSGIAPLPTTHIFGRRIILTCSRTPYTQKRELRIEIPLYFEDDPTEFIENLQRDTYVHLSLSLNEDTTSPNERKT